MKEWLENIKAPKFLRYLFFIAYIFYRRFTSERSDAHNTAILLLAFAHLFITMNIVFVFENSLPSSVTGILIFGSLVLIHFVLFYHCNKWKLYVEEFKHMKRKKQNIGFIYLLVYLFLNIYVIGIKIGLNL